MGWIIAGGILLLLALILSLSAAADVRYDGEFYLSVGILGWRYPILPAKEEPEQKKPAKKKQSAPKKRKTGPAPPPKPKEKPEKGDLGGLFRIVSDLLKAVFPPLGKLLCKLRLTRLEADILVGGEDAAQIATDYGKICAVFYSSYAALQNLMKIKARRVDISCDFLLPKTREDISFTLKLRLGSILWAALCMGGRFLVYTIRRGREELPSAEIKNPPEAAPSGIQK